MPAAPLLQRQRLLRGVNMSGFDEPAQEAPARVQTAPAPHADELVYRRFHPREQCHAARRRSQPDCPWQDVVAPICRPTVALLLSPLRGQLSGHAPVLQSRRTNTARPARHGHGKGRHVAGRGPGGDGHARGRSVEARRQDAAGRLWRGVAGLQLGCHQAGRVVSDWSGLDQVRRARGVSRVHHQPGLFAGRVGIRFWGSGWDGRQQGGRPRVLYRESYEEAPCHYVTWAISRVWLVVGETRNARFPQSGVVLHRIPYMSAHGKWGGHNGIVDRSEYPAQPLAAATTAAAGSIVRQIRGGLIPVAMPSLGRCAYHDGIFRVGHAPARSKASTRLAMCSSHFPFRSRMLPALTRACDEPSSEMPCRPRHAW